MTQTSSHKTFAAKLRKSISTPDQRAVYETLLKNIPQCGSPQLTLRQGAALSDHFARYSTLSSVRIICSATDK
jgi:hypothetical protein